MLMLCTFLIINTMYGQAISQISRNLYWTPLRSYFPGSVVISPYYIRLLDDPYRVSYSEFIDYYYLLFPTNEEDEHIRNTMLNILYKVHAIGDEHETRYYDPSQFTSLFFYMILKRLSEMAIDPMKEGSICPESYDRVGDLCLRIGSGTDSSFTYAESKTICEELEGDLAIIRTPNEHRAVINYLWIKDPDRDNNYFLGCRSGDDNVLYWKDRTLVKITSTYFASTQFSDAANTCILSKDKYYFMDLTTDDASSSTLPLCQYKIPISTGSFQQSQQKYLVQFNEISHNFFSPLKK